MELRDRDAVDYLAIGVVTLLAYLQLPWRPEIRQWLRSVAATAVALVEFLLRFVFGQPLWVYVILGLLLGVAILVALVELPKAGHA